MAQAAKEPLTLVPGTVLDGRFRIERHLATGGMGEIYRAEHIYMKRRVALKLLRPEWADQSEMAVRFQREGQLISQLDHPQIVRVFDFGRTSDGLFFLAMELIEGQSLEELLQLRGQLPPRLAVQVLKLIASALEGAHRQGIMHRDLKPDNILLTRRSDGDAGGSPFGVKVLDFGLARLIEPDVLSRVTRAGLVLGTPAYLSPEQAMGQSIDHRADLYSLSVIGYRMLAGRLPFVSDNPRELFSLHAGEAPPLLVSLRPEMAKFPDLAALIERGLAKDPQSRPASAEAYGEALEQLMPPLTATISGALPAVALDMATTGGRRPTRRVHLPSKWRRSQNLTLMVLQPGAVGAHLPADLLDLEPQLLPILRGYGGRLVRSGCADQVVVFTSPTDALHCATAAQDWFFERSAELAEAERCSLRIAVNLGEVHLQRGSVSGEPVELTAVLNEVGEWGDVCFTEAVYLAMNRGQVRSETIGVKDLPGIDHPVKLYRVMREPGALTAPPYGGRALAPLRSRLEGQGLMVRMGDFMGGTIGGLRAASAWLLHGIIAGTPLHRAAILGGFALVATGFAFGMSELSLPTPAGPPPAVTATPPDRRSFDEVLADLKGVHGCAAQLRDAQRLDQLADKRGEAILHSLAQAPAGLLDSAECDKLHRAAHRALDRLRGN
jgi:class 3 adenylate cyclase/tRNA A-37 threonylcarbamoyl transferase component Bud32